MRKAQIQTQIFIYILSIVIVGLVLLYGYNAIRGFRERQEQVSLIEVENNLKNTIKAMSSEYDSIKQEKLLMPAGNELICFVDNDFLEYDGTDCVYNEVDRGLISIEDHIDPKVEDSWFIVKNAIEAGTANIFLVPDGTENYLIGNIKLPDVYQQYGCLCIEKVGNQAIFRVRGLGNGVEIKEWS